MPGHVEQCGRLLCQSHRAGLVAPTLPPWDPSRGRVLFPELVTAGADGLPAGLHLVDDGLLPTLGIPIVAGRNFTAGEATDVAIVSRGLASRLGGEQAAIGRTIDVEVPDKINELIAAGALGRKAGHGFHTY